MLHAYLTITYVYVIIALILRYFISSSRNGDLSLTKTFTENWLKANDGNPEGGGGSSLSGLERLPKK